MDEKQNVKYKKEYIDSYQSMCVYNVKIHCFILALLKVWHCSIISLKSVGKLKLMYYELRTQCLEDSNSPSLGSIADT